MKCLDSQILPRCNGRKEKLKNARWIAWFGLFELCFPVFLERFLGIKYPWLKYSQNLGLKYPWLKYIHSAWFRHANSWRNFGFHKLKRSFLLFLRTKWHSETKKSTLSPHMKSDNFMARYSRSWWIYIFLSPVLLALIWQLREKWDFHHFALTGLITETIERELSYTSHNLCLILLRSHDIKFIYRFHYFLS